MKRRFTKTALAVAVGAMALLGHRSLVTAQPLICANCLPAILAPDLVPPEIQPPLQGEIWYQTQQTWLPAPAAAAQSNGKIKGPTGPTGETASTSANRINYCVIPYFKVGVASNSTDMWTTSFTLALMGGVRGLSPVKIDKPFNQGSMTSLDPSPVWCVEAPANQPPNLTLVTRFGKEATIERRAPVVFGPQPVRLGLPPRSANPTN